MFAIKRKNKMNDFERSMKECMDAYNKLNKILDQKTMELDVLIKEEEKTQEEMFAIMDYQMEVLNAHI